MRHLSLIVIAIALVAVGCGDVTEPTTDDIDTAAAHAGPPAETVASMPDDDVHAQAMGDAMHGGSGINAEVNLDPEIADDWQAIRVRLVNLETGDESLHEVEMGGSTVLGDSGLTIRAVTFIPDFVMNEGGITTRSAEPRNPAARVVITEEGAPDHEGWLFGAMPAIHAYEHPVYRVLLVEGIPAS
jgi:hypothetical protein